MGRGTGPEGCGSRGRDLSPGWVLQACWCACPGATVGCGFLACIMLYEREEDRTGVLAVEHRHLESEMRQCSLATQKILRPCGLPSTQTPKTKGRACDSQRRARAQSVPLGLRTLCALEAAGDLMKMQILNQRPGLDQSRISHGSRVTWELLGLWPGLEQQSWTQAGAAPLPAQRTRAIVLASE